jgi:Mg-chelatase subunit ChlD
MAILADIVLDADRNMIVGLRDRLGDVTLTIAHFGHNSAADDPVGLGIGDIVRGAPGDDGWVFDPAREHFRDGIKDASESALGGIASFSPTDYLVGAVLGQVAGNVFRPIPDQGVVWWDTTSGNKLRHEGLCVHGKTLVRPWEQVAHSSLLPEVLVASADNEGQAPGNAGDVEVLCGAEGVPSPTPSRTATQSTTPEPPTPTSTSTAEPSPTAASPPPPTPTATATAVPAPIFLPLALREHCAPEYQRADIALVIDTSSSMAGQKLADAKSAALLFVDLIDLAPGRSQVAVIRFDREAEVVRELTRSRTLIEAAIRGLQVRSGTHIDKGLRTALGELQSPRHLDRNLPVMILLTDGLQTGTPGEELRAAAEVRGDSVLLYTIGLGSDVDETALKTMAGDETRYYYAPDSADLVRIYSEIAQDLRCPGKELWGGR